MDWETLPRLPDFGDCRLPFFSEVAILDAQLTYVGNATTGGMAAAMEGEIWGQSAVCH